MNTFKSIAGLALTGVAYLTILAARQVHANVVLIATTFEDLVHELATVTEITDAVITPDYVEIEDTGIDHCYPCVAPATVDYAPSHDTHTSTFKTLGVPGLGGLGVRELRRLAQEQGIKIRLAGTVLTRAELISALEAHNH